MHLSDQMIGRNLSRSKWSNWAELSVGGMLVFTLKDHEEFK